MSFYLSNGFQKGSDYEQPLSLLEDCAAVLTPTMSCADWQRESAARSAPGFLLRRNHGRGTPRWAARLGMDLLQDAQLSHVQRAARDTVRPDAVLLASQPALQRDGASLSYKVHGVRRLAFNENAFVFSEDLLGTELDEEV